MSITYAQKQAAAQKKDSPTVASILDASSQSESLQRKADLANNAVQRAESPRPNNTGMPDNLKTGIESLSGFSMDDVRVHYNSSKPAAVQALAYTQGTDIHVAPGQEKHLPHEAWHVAQQKAGRVSPTTNINGMPVNDNAGLEHEADVMGEKAITQRKHPNILKNQKNLGAIQRTTPLRPEGESIINNILNGTSELFYEKFDEKDNTIIWNITRSSKGIDDRYQIHAHLQRQGYHLNMKSKKLYKTGEFDKNGKEKKKAKYLFYYEGKEAKDMAKRLGIDVTINKIIRNKHLKTAVK